MSKTAWPDVTFVSDVHPMVEWLVDKVLLRLGRQQAPVLLADVDAGVIGAAHAGWKGAISGVLASAVRLMREHGATNIAAAIGPTIHQPSYEVGPEFEARFVEKDSQFARYFEPGAGDRRLFDLPRFCADQLRALGIARIETLPLDTYALPQTLHSHRYAVHQKWADYGRNCAAIAL
jgi:YfiH family protein